MSTERIKKLYRKRDDGSVGFAEISSYSYPDADSFNEAVDFLYEKGYFDTYSEAKEADYIPPNTHSKAE